MVYIHDIKLTEAMELGAMSSLKFLPHPINVSAAQFQDCHPDPAKRDSGSPMKKSRCRIPAERDRHDSDGQLQRHQN